MNLQQRIDDFLEERANAESDWDEHQSAFTDFMEMELQDQRAMCANSISKCLVDMHWDTCIDKNLREVCINAVEKK